MAAVDWEQYRAPEQAAGSVDWEQFAAPEETKPGNLPKGIFGLEENIGKNAGNYLKETGTKQFWKDVPKGIVSGVANLPQDILNLPIQAGNYLNKTNAPMIPRWKIAPESMGAQTGEVLSNLLPSGAGLAKFGGTLAEGIGQAGKVLGKGTLKGASEFTPSSIASRVLPSHLTAEQLKRNLEVTKGTNTGLGQIVESPSLNALQENVIGKIPFSGADKGLHRTGQEILRQGENLVNKHLGETHPLEVSDKLGESLMTAKENETNIKDAYYKKAEEAADETGFKPKLDKFEDQLREHGEDILSANVFQFEPKIKALVTNIIKGSNAKHISLKEANMMAGKLNGLANQYGTSVNISDRNAARVLGNMGRALKDDIKASIAGSGNKKLIEHFGEAEKNYKENYSSFLDKDIHKFTTGQKSADDLVASFLKTSNTSDKADQLEKLMKVMPEADHDLVRYSYFSRALEGAEGEQVVNPNKLKTLWNKLGNKQKQILIPDEKDRRAFDNFVMLVNKNPKAVNKMWNPNTGQINSDLIKGWMIMHPVKSLKEVAGGWFGNKALTSEKFREKTVGKMIERKEKKALKENK